MAVPVNLEIRYVFTMSANVTATPVGETPTGYRVDVQYQIPGTVSTDVARYYDDWVATLSPADFSALVAYIGGATATAFQGKPATSATPAEKGTIVAAIVTMRKAAVPPAPAPPQPPPPAMATLGWYGLDAELLSGSDWAIIRSDGVAEFTGRLTLRSTDSDEGLLSVTAGGPVDLLTVMGGVIGAVPPSPSQGLQTVLNAVQGGQLAPAPVLMAATFDAAGVAESWAPKRMKRQADGFWKYKILTRSQFAGLGHVAFGQNVNTPITSVKLDIYRLRFK
jgi:hypothetical protein